MELGLDTLLPWKAAAVAVWLALFFAAERLRPAAPAPEGDAAARGGFWRLARNGGLWLGNLALSPLLVVPVSLLASQHHLGWRPDWWSGPAGLALDLVLLDFLIYWWHRANHVFAFLWRFHEVHHLDRFLDTTSAVRFHFGEVALSALARAGFIVVFDIPLASILVFETVVLGAAIFHHSNLALLPALERALARAIITPSIHWVHHHARRRDTDSNYGTLFSFWDPLFGTRSATAREPHMIIGVEGVTEQPLDRLLIRPFLSPRRRAAAAGPGTKQSL